MDSKPHAKQRAPRGRAAERILLVSLPVAGGYRGTLVSPFVELVPPLGLLALAPRLREAGLEPSLLDLSTARRPRPALREALHLIEPAVVGLTVLTPEVQAARGLVRLVRREAPKATIWAGGVHPSVFPRESIHDIDLDGAIAGEGDFAFAQALRAGERAGEVPGAFVRLEGRLVVGPPPRTIEPLDRLPLPAWDLVRLEDYAGRGGLRPAGHVPGPIETSRGCALRCSFCTKAVHGGRFRPKSPGRVVEEMRRLASLGFGEAHVLDDCFNTSVPRAREICERLAAEKLGLPWNCRVGIRPDRVDAALLGAMRKAGCYRVSFGVESGSQAVLDSAGKNLRVEESERAVRLATQAGIETMAFFVLGLPAETRETVRQTIAFARRIRPTFAKFALFTPLPSTPAWDDLAREGRLTVRSWGDLNFHRLPPRAFRHPHLGPRALARAYIEAYARFYLPPGGWLGRARAWARPRLGGRHP